MSETTYYVYVSRPKFWKLVHRFGSYLCRIASRHDKYTEVR